MERVASLILNLRNGTEDESATNVEHRGAHGDVIFLLFFPFVFICISPFFYLYFVLLKVNIYRLTFSPLTSLAYADRVWSDVDRNSILHTRIIQMMSRRYPNPNFQPLQLSLVALRTVLRF